MTEVSTTDIEKPLELVGEFDILRLDSVTSVAEDIDVPTKGNDPNKKLPGMTDEYLDFVYRSFPSGIVPLDDLDATVYNPLKSAYPDKFQGDKLDLEFFSVCTVNGKKVYKKLSSGKERDRAVQRDIYELIKRRKLIEVYVQSLRFKLQTKRQDLSSLKTPFDPAKIFLFDCLINNVEKAIDRGISCGTTLKQLDRFVTLGWILLFEKDIAKKRKDFDDQCYSNKYNPTTCVASDQSSKRIKGNAYGTEPTGNLSIVDNGSITISSSNDDDAESNDIDVTD